MSIYISNVLIGPVAVLVPGPSTLPREIYSNRDIWVGDSGVTAGNGLQLAAGRIYTLPAAEYYVYCSVAAELDIRIIDTAVSGVGDVSSVDGRTGVVTLGDRYDVVGAAATARTNAENTAQAALNAHKTSTDHDGRYFTEAEVTSLLTGKAAVSHAASHLSGGADPLVALAMSQVTDLVSTVAGVKDYFNVIYDEANNAWPAVPSSPNPPVGYKWWRFTSRQSSSAVAPQLQTTPANWSFLTSVNNWVWRPHHTINPL